MVENISFFCLFILYVQTICFTDVLFENMKFKGRLILYVISCALGLIGLIVL